MEIIFSEAANRDLDNIYQYISENFGNTLAKKVVDEFFSKIGLLTEQPQMGTFFDSPHTRFIVIKKNVVVYNIHDNHIIITRIYTKGKDWR